jgi:hypothetical protein
MLGADADEADTDLLFAGLGVAPLACDGVATPPRASSCPTRFSQERVLAVLRGGYTYGGPGNIAQLGAEAVVNHRRFAASADDELEDDDLDIGSVYDTAQLVGFADGSTTLELLGRLVVDTRAPRGLVDPGVRFEAFAGGAAPVAGYAYAHYGAELTATTPLFWRTRLLTVRAALEDVHGGAGDIPFAELSRLGGPDRLRGYAVDQLRDRLAIFVGASYRYPVHHAISGVLFVDVGTVAADYAGLLDDADDLRLGFGGGLVFGDADDIALRVDIGYGDGLHLYVSTEPPRAFGDRSEQL